jgi:hypothetical protein
MATSGMSEDERVGSPVNNGQVVDLRDDLAIGQWNPRIERPTCLPRQIQAAAR